MKEYQRQFIQLCLDNGVLRFGEFVLKSKRISPYFFNGGNFYTGNAYLNLGKFYAETVLENFTLAEYDILFGPAYKGITLATCTSIGLAQKNINIPICYNRKEAKDHGEGGIMVGAPLSHKRAILIDDVITAGTTIREAVNITKQENGKLVGIVIALDRQEIGLKSNLSAIQEVENEFGIKVASIICLSDLIEYLQETPELVQHIPAMLNYKKQYGIDVM